MINRINKKNKIVPNNSKNHQKSNQQLINKGEVLIQKVEEVNVDAFDKQKVIHNFYNFPKYYDLAFTRDIDNDIKFFQRCFNQYSNLNVKGILEPACGPGIFLEKLPLYGYYCLGYDISEAMVNYSKERLKRVGVYPNKANVVLGDMKNMVFDSKFDAAIICINSLGYLIRGEDISSHFKAMGKSLKKGGIYIVEISFKCDDLGYEKKIDDTWYVKEDGIELEVTWAINWYDMEHQIRHVDFQMVINDNGKRILLQESHDLRLWLFEDFKTFASSGGFKLVGIYNQKYELIPERTTINGELGAVFLILKKMEDST